MSVTFDADFLALAHNKEIDLPWPTLWDPEQSLYQPDGKMRGSWWSIYDLPSVWKYLKRMARGRRPGKPRKDRRQLSGDDLRSARQRAESITIAGRPTIASLSILAEHRRMLTDFVLMTS